MNEQNERIKSQGEVKDRRIDNWLEESNDDNDSNNGANNNRREKNQKGKGKCRGHITSTLRRKKIGEDVSP